MFHVWIFCVNIAPLKQHFVHSQAHTGQSKCLNSFYRLNVAPNANIKRQIKNLKGTACKYDGRGEIWVDLGRKQAFFMNSDNFLQKPIL